MRLHHCFGDLAHDLEHAVCLLWRNSSKTALSRHAEVQVWKCLLRGLDPLLRTFKVVFANDAEVDLGAVFLQPWQ